MKRIVTLIALFATLSSFAQRLVTGDKDVDAAFDLAVWTVDHNTENMLLKAGGDYGGEWTRDCAMNAWNAASLIRPQVAEYSLWSVTNQRQTIGHQYWDKIIWVIAAWNHYLVNGDRNFLRTAYFCSAKTMAELRRDYYDSRYGLFTGPAVFQDGIAAYDEPMYEPARHDRSYVLEHPRAPQMKCLSTNAVYYEAYRILTLMARELGDRNRYEAEARALKHAIRQHLYDARNHRLFFLLDDHGRKHDEQEGLGVAYAVMFDILSESEARQVLQGCHITEHGIPAVWPCYIRFSEDKPGRHNVMIWPQVNMYYASACAHVGERRQFWFEVRNLADLALHHSVDGKPNYHEIYTEKGRPSGGWQCDHEWAPLNHQTWAATGFLRAIITEVFGLHFETNGLRLEPLGMDRMGTAMLSDIRYRGANITVKLSGTGGRIASCRINGRPAKPFIPAGARGNYVVEIQFQGGNTAVGGATVAGGRR